MATSDEDLQKKTQNVADLRQKVAEANAARENTERNLTNDVTAAALDAEAAKLEAELVEALYLGKLAAGNVPEVAKSTTPPAPAAPAAPAATTK